MFGLLDDDEEVIVEAGGAKKEESNDLQVSSSDSDATNAADSAAWTDVSSTKARRLAPQWTATKQGSASPSSTSTEISKKKGLDL